MGAVVRDKLPSAGLINPGVTANHRAGPMCSIEGRIVGELVMRHCDVGPKGRNLDITDLALGEIDSLVLHLLQSLILSRPLTPAMSLDVTVGQVLLIQNTSLFFCAVRISFSSCCTFEVAPPPDCATNVVARSRQQNAAIAIVVLRFISDHHCVSILVLCPLDYAVASPPSGIEKPT
jgi:hypothetical protein